MAKDYVKRQARNQRKSKKLPWKLGLLTLLLLGLFITGLTLLNHKKTPTPSKPAAAPQTTPPPTQPQPQFDFYTILPKEQIDITKLSALPKATTKYFLQVAVLSNDTNADHLKSELALLGFDVYINKIKTDNNKLLNQVNIGPYFSHQAALNDQQRLTANHIDSILKQEKN